MIPVGGIFQVPKSAGFCLGSARGRYGRNLESRKKGRYFSPSLSASGGVSGGAHDGFVVLLPAKQPALVLFFHQVTLDLASGTSLCSPSVP